MSGSDDQHRLNSRQRREIDRIGQKFHFNLAPPPSSLDEITTGPKFVSLTDFIEQRLPRNIGRKAAIELILTGRTFDAAEAARLGLVNRVVPTVSPENALVPCNTRCKMLHCQNFDLKTLFMNVINRFGWNEGKFAPVRETPLALSFDSNLFGFVT